MFSIRYLTASLPLLLLSLTPLPLPAQGDGTSLARQVYARSDGTDAAVRGTMVLTEQGHQPRIRELFSYTRDDDQGQAESLIRFVAPADIRQVGLLTINSAGRQEDQWLYLPSLDRARRIPATRQGGRFVGSDLYYEDLQDRPVAEDHHRILRQEAVDGIETTVLESVPVDPGNSVYSRRISWVHQETLLPLRVDFYQGGDEPAKRLKVNRIEQVQGYWTVMDSTMTDLDSGHSTRLVVDDIRYDQGLPDDLFSRQALEDSGYEVPFRP